MRRLTCADYRRMPWQNGGGTTTEILVEPPRVDRPEERFLYRVSIADVAGDGPFSRFEGYERHIMLLAGRGMTLECGEHGRVDLLAPFQPRSFSGDWDVRGNLVAGAVRDFNLIVDRARASSSLEVRLLDTSQTVTLDAKGIWIVHVITGAIVGAEEGDTIVTDTSFDLAPRGTARVAIGHIVLRH
jgi:environmental stress-induced protein Ves